MPQINEDEQLFNKVIDSENLKNKLQKYTNSLTVNEKNYIRNTSSKKQIAALKRLMNRTLWEYKHIQESY